jgi:2-polyprenyl-3-methyl-5-hydroxy-6-metoxy-1,4-benzoquinol methylase
MRDLGELKLLDPENYWRQRKKVIVSLLKDYFKNRIEPIKILDAGCGIGWHMNLGSIPFQIIGVDHSKKELEMRQTSKGDLALAIVGDLRTISFKRREFDCIYCFDVIEHLDGAKNVIDNFFEWLRPGGLLVLVFPDRETVFGFITRITPFWFHVAFSKYILGSQNAGKPGFGPYPTCYDKIVSRRGIHEYSNRHNFKILLEYGVFQKLFKRSTLGLLLRLVIAKLFHYFSFGRLSADHNSLVYVIRSPDLKAWVRCCISQYGLSPSRARMYNALRNPSNQDLQKVVDTVISWFEAKEPR